VRQEKTETITVSKTAPHLPAIYNEPREIWLKSLDKRWMIDVWRCQQAGGDGKDRWDDVAPIARVEMRYAGPAFHELACEHVKPNFAEGSAQ